MYVRRSPVNAYLVLFWTATKLLPHTSASKIRKTHLLGDKSTTPLRLRVDELVSTVHHTD